MSADYRKWLLAGRNRKYYKRDWQASLRALRRIILNEQHETPISRPIHRLKPGGCGIINQQLLTTHAANRLAVNTQAPRGLPVGREHYRAAIGTGDRIIVDRS